MLFQKNYFQLNRDLEKNDRLILSDTPSLFHYLASIEEIEKTSLFV